MQSELLENSSLGVLFIQATSMLKDMGYEPPTSVIPPSDAEMQRLIYFFDPPSTQEAIREMFNSLQGCQDFGAAVPEVVQKVMGNKPVASIDPASALKLIYIRSGDILVSTNNEDLSLLCESIESKVQLKCGDIVEIINVGKFEVLSVGSENEQWVLRELIVIS